MCEKVVKARPWKLEYVSEHLKMKEICKKVVEAALGVLKYVSDYFVTKQQIKTWHDDDKYCNGHELIEWYKGHQKHKSQKASIKEEFMPIAWHLSRYWDWCIPEDEKKGTKFFLIT